jgi:hypothetical protein
MHTQHPSFRQIHYLISFLLFLVAGSGLNAQSEFSYNKGDWFISFGTGYPNQNTLLLKPISKEYEFDYKGRGPFHFKAEYAILEHLGVGIAINRVAFDAHFKVKNEDLAKLFDYHLTYGSTSVLARINGHFPATGSLDIYGGFGLGIKTGRPKLVSDDPKKRDFSFPFTFPIGMELTVGGRLKIIDPIYIYVETGLAKSFIQGGITVRI